MGSKRKPSGSGTVAMIANYKTPDDSVRKHMSIADRVAHFLDWAAVHSPNTYFPVNIILKAIDDLSTTPQMNNQGIPRIQSALTRAKEILMKKYKRGYANSRGLGVRATKDVNDTVRHTVMASAKRLASSKSNLDKVTDMVQQQVDGGARLGAEEDAIFQGVTRASKRIGAEHFRALLPSKTG